MMALNLDLGLAFSLITGQGLGTSHSSFNSVGSFLPSRLFGQAELQCAVNMANGNTVFQDRTLSFPDIGNSVEFSYVYNSLNNTSSSGWHLSFGRQIKKIIEKKSIIVTEADGHELEYIYDVVSDSYQATSYQDGKPVIRFDKESSCWNWYHPVLRVTEQFDANGKLKKRIDKTSNETCYEYDENNQLRIIIAPSGVHYEIKRDKQKIEIYVNKEKPILLHTYLFDQFGNLTKSITRDQYEITYDYTQKSQLKSVAQSDGSSLAFGYYEDSKLHTLQVGNTPDNFNKFIYDEKNKKTTFEDIAGVKSILTFDEYQQPFEFLSANEDLIRYQHNHANQVEKIIYPDNSEEKFDYDVASGLLSQYIHRDGTVTKYEYSKDTDHPILLTTSKFATQNDLLPIATIRYIYDENFKGKQAQLRYEISSLGHVKEYLLNPKNGLIEGEREFLNDVYDFASNDAPTLNVMDFWVDRLKKAGHLSNTTLTKYGYDEQGRINHIIRYANVDAQGVGIENEMMTEEIFSYDEWGHIIRRSVKCGENQYHHAEYAYNDLGHQLRETIGTDSALKQETLHSYAGGEIGLTLPNGRLETQISNSEGLIEFESVVAEINDNKQERKKTYIHDEKNHVRIVTLPDKNKILQFYDDQRRVSSIVSPSGLVTDFKYNKKYRYQVKTEYANPIDIAALYPAQSMVGYYIGSYLGWPAGNPIRELLVKALEGKKDKQQDRRSYVFSGVRDEPRYEIDADNYLTEYQYNSLGKLINKITYKKEISQEELDVLLNGNDIHRVPNRKIDCVYSDFYDNDGYKIGEQDPAGYVTNFIRDSAGRIIEEIHYDTKDLNVSLNFKDIHPSENKEKDAHHYYFYNSLNQCTLEVGAEGYVTTHIYCSDKKKDKSVRYETKVDKFWYQNTKEMPMPLKSEKGNDEETAYKYDDLRRLIGIHYSSGKSITYTYDEMNHVIENYTYDRDYAHSVLGDHCRGIESHYDVWEQEIVHINPFVAQKLAEIKYSRTLSDIERRQAKEKLLKEQSERAEFNTIGLKVKTLDPYGNATIYFYDKEKRPIVIIDATGAITENTLNSFGEVEVERKCYRRLPKDILSKLSGGYLADDISKLIQYDSKDATTKYKYDHRGQIIERTDSEGNISRFEYDALKRCTHEYLPVEDKLPSLHIEHQYEQRGYETKTTKTSKDDSLIIVEKRYDHYLGKVTDLFNEVGGHTHYERDRLGNVIETKEKVESGDYITTEKIVLNAFSQPIKKTNADNETIDIDYNQKERTKTISYAGCKEKTIIHANVFGEETEISHVVTNENAILSQEVYSHAPDGSIESKRNGLNQTSTNQFDLLGRVEGEIDPLAVKTVYQRNEAGQVNATILDADKNGLQLKICTEPNAFGQNEILIDARGTIQKNEFDRRGYLLSNVKDPGENGLNLTTKYIRNAQGSETDVIQGDIREINQYHVKHEMDGFNRIKANIIDPEKLNIRTEFERDAAGNIIKETDSNGHIKHTYFNLQQKKRFEIRDYDDGEVSAVEYAYTDAGKLKSIRTYDKPIRKDYITDQTKLADLKKLFELSQNDTVTLFFYDKKGREQFKLKLVYSLETNRLEAFVEEKEYNSVDKAIVSRLYAKALDASQYANWTTDLIAELVSGIKNSDEDRILYHWYDRVPRECLLINQDGVIIEKRYDAAGRIIAEICYDTPLDNPIQYLSADLDAVLSKIERNTEHDRAKYYVYDNAGRLNFTVSANRFVTRKDYDENSNTIEICEFKDSIKIPGDYEQSVKLLKKLVPVQEKDALTKTDYDRDDRMTSIIDALGNNDKFERDALGGLKKYIDRDNYAWGYEFDRAKRLVAELSPKTTIAEVERDVTGKLVYKDIEVSVKKKTDFDKAGNAICITEGDGLEKSRPFNLQYGPQNKLQATSIETKIDDKENIEACKNQDLSVLPEKSTNLMTRIITNTKGKTIAEMNEAGVWSYYIYDSAEQLIYEIRKNKAVTHYTYNAFGEVTCERQFDKPIALNLTQYDPKKITGQMIKEAVTPSDQDRVTTHEYNRAGKVISIKSSAVFYYSSGQSGTENPETKKDYNTFGNCIYEAKLIRLGVWAEKFSWVNNDGHVVAEIDENKHLICYERSIGGRELERIEYANPTTLSLSCEQAKKLSIDALKENITKSPKDRKYVFGYDLLGQKTSEQIFVRKAQSDEFINPITYKLDYKTENGRSIPVLVPQDKELIKRWTYTKRQKVKSITYEDGQTEYKYYEPRGILIGETAVTRTNVHGNKEKITPLFVYKLDAFGQCVATQRSTVGCEIPASDTLPHFLNPDKVSEEVLLYDNRGLNKFKQDAEGNLTAFTYTPTRKVARQMQPVNIWHKDVSVGLTDSFPLEEENDWVVIDKSEDEGLRKDCVDVSNHYKDASKESKDNSRYVYKGAKEGWIVKDKQEKEEKHSLLTPKVTFKQQKHVDEKQFVYNDFDLTTKVSYLREGVEEEAIHTKYNMFGDFVAEGLSDNDLPFLRKVDTRGNTWCTNGESGAKTISLYDLRGLETLRVQSTERDLSAVSYSDLSQILTWDPKQLAKTETVYDAGGRPTAMKSPLWYRNPNQMPTRQYQYDHWNKIKEIDAYGQETKDEFDHNNHLIKKIQPEVNVVGIDWVCTRTRPVTVHGHNERGFKIGATDANGHTEVYELNEAGQWVTKILPEGTRIQSRELNAFGQVKVSQDARGKQWKYDYDQSGQLTTSFFPSGRNVVRTYDGKGGLSSVTDSSGATLRYNNDVRGNVWERYLPLGQLTRTAHDHNGQSIYVLNPDNSSLTWKRDYFGHPLEHVDLSGRITKFMYNNMYQLSRQYSQGGPPRDCMRIDIGVNYFQSAPKDYPIVHHVPKMQPVPPQDVYYQYEYGMLIFVSDKGLNKNTFYGYDLEARREKVRIERSDGLLLHNIETSHDELGRESSSVNEHISVSSFHDKLISTTSYDAGNNRRCFSVSLHPNGYAANCKLEVQNQTHWFTYDEADRICIHGGNLTNRKIHLSPNHGVQYEYSNGFRVAEKSLNAQGALVTVGLEYNDDGALVVSNASTGLRTERDYHINGWVERYREILPSNRTENRIILNDNGWQIGSESYHNNSLESATVYSNIPDFGLPYPYHQTTTYNDADRNVDEYDFIYTGFDTWMQSSIKGKRRNKHGQGPESTALYLYDSNGSLNAKDNSVDEPNPFLWYGWPNFPTFFDTHYDGWILNKQYVLKGTPGHPESDTPNVDRTYQYLYDVNGGVSGGYYIQSDIQKLALHFAIEYKHMGTGHLAPEVSKFVTRDFVHSIGKITPIDKNAKNDPLGWNNINASLGIQTYIVNLGDSLESIAKKQFGDSSFAAKIAEINGLPLTGFALKAGQVLRLPQYVGMQNKADNTRSYQEFMNLMAGSLSPRLITPQPKIDDDTDWFGMIVKMIAVGIVLSVAPSLAGYVLLSAGIPTALAAGGGATALTTVDVIATGVAAALGDAAVQGLAIELGAQSKFSATEMLETGVTAGVGLGLPEVTSLATASELAFKVGSAAVTTQLAEMAAGLRDKFDARAIALQVSASLVNSQINRGAAKVFGQDTHATVIGSNAASAVTGGFLGRGITGTPLNIKNMTANAVGSTMSSELGGNLAKSIGKMNEKSPVNGASQQILPKKDYTSHEINEAEAVANFKLSDPGLKIEGERYGKLNYQLSEMSRARLSDRSSTKPDITGSTLKILSMFSQGTLAGGVINDIKNVYTVAHGNSSERYEALEELGKEVAIGVGVAATGGLTGAAARTVPFLRQQGLFTRRLVDLDVGNVISKATDTLDSIDSNILNQQYISEGYFPPYDPNYRIRNILLSEDRIFVRVHSETNQVSKWMMRAKEIANLTPLQIKEKFALEFMPEYMSQVDVPVGTTMRVSVAGPQTQWGVNGGGIQYELMSRIPLSSFKHQVPIHQPLLEPNYFAEPYEGWRSIMLR